MNLLRVADRAAWSGLEVPFRRAIRSLRGGRRALLGLSRRIRHFQIGKL